MSCPCNIWLGTQLLYSLRLIINDISKLVSNDSVPSVLWRCWLGGRKGIRPAKTEWWVAGMVICLWWGADLHMAQLMPPPLTVSCFSKIQIGFTFLLLAHLGNPGQYSESHKMVVCGMQWYQLPEFIPSKSNSGLHSCISISIRTQHVNEIAKHRLTPDLHRHQYK